MFQIFQMFQIAGCIFEIQPQETATVRQNRHIRANRRVVETSQDGMVADVDLIALHLVFLQQRAMNLSSTFRPKSWTPLTKIRHIQ